MPRRLWSEMPAAFAMEILMSSTVASLARSMDAGRFLMGFLGTTSRGGSC